MSATLRFAAGNLRRGSCGVRRETLFALRATFKHHGESDHEAVLSFGRTATPQPPRRRRWHTGSWCGPSLRSAPGLKPNAVMAPAVGCWLLAIPQPPPFCPRLRWAGCGVAALPKDRAASSS